MPCGDVLTKMMEGGPNRGEIFNYFVTPGSTPDLPHAKQTPLSPSHDSQLLLGAVYCGQYMYIWLITSSKTERACANRNARLLDIVRYGRVRVIDNVGNAEVCIGSEQYLLIGSIPFITTQ